MHCQVVFQRLDERLAIAQSRQRIAPLAGEGHQPAALLANAVVGMGQLHPQVLRRLEQSLGFVAEQSANRRRRRFGDFAHAALEGRQVRVVQRQLAADAVSDLLQIEHDRLGPLQLAARGVGRSAAVPVYWKRPKT